jgi:site-specific DNA-methyltransferase (adenine-specific)
MATRSKAKPKPANLKHIAKSLHPLAEPIDAVKQDPANARSHDGANLAAIVASLERFGQRRPIVVNRRNKQIEAGNATHEAAKRLGWAHVAVVWVTDDKKAQLGFSIADNRTAELAGWSEDELAAALLEIGHGDEGLAEALLLDELATAQGIDLTEPGAEDLQDPEPQLDRAAELQKEWGTELGQLWTIEGKAGVHRILCGDCAAVAVLADDEAVAAFVADPPYASGGLHAGARKQAVGDKYQQTSSKAAYCDWSGDQKDQRAWTFWCTAWLQAWRQRCGPGAYGMVFVDWRQLPAMTDAIQAANWEWRGINVWDKTEGARVAHQGMFRLQAEYVVWASAGHLEPWTEEGQGVVPGVYREAVDKEKVHLTQKPVGVLAWLIGIARKREGVIVDPFLGSGTTLVACEQLGRVGVGIEISPGYVAVALQRMKDMGLVPQLAED